MLVVPVPEPDSGALLHCLPGVEGTAENPVGRGVEGDWEVEGPVGGGGVRDLLAGEVCGRTVLDILSTTDVGKRVPAEQDAVSKVLEAELREWEEE